MSFAPQWTFQTMMATARQISGLIDSEQASDSYVAFNINSAYQYDLPRLMKVEELYTQYTFMTLPNIATYDLPGNFNGGPGPFTHVEPELFINGQPIFYTQDTNVFYSRTPKLFATETLGFGDGVTTTFNYATLNNPIIPDQQASVMITELAPKGSGYTSLESFYDLGDGDALNGYTGTLQSSLYPSGGSGQVAYNSYPYSNDTNIQVTFDTAPSQGQQLEVTYHFEQLGFPTIVLLYDRQFTFYPTPDTTYQVRIDAFFQPPQLVNPTDVPIKQEWAELVCVMAARKMLRNFGQIDKYVELEGYFEEEKTKVRSDTDNQSMATRARPMC